jgi:hypothetical protein
VIHQSFKSLFTDSSHVKFDRPLPLLLLPAHLITPLRIGASAGLRCICPNHLKRCCTSFSSTGATPSLSRMSSFRTRSLLLWPQIHRSIRISATLSCWTCCLLVMRLLIFIIKNDSPVNVAPACAGSEEGSNQFRSYVCILSLHFCKRLFPEFEPMTSCSPSC